MGLRSRCRTVGAESAWGALCRSQQRASSPQSGLGGLGLASDTARVLLAGLVEPGLDARLPILAEMVTVKNADEE